MSDIKPQREAYRITDAAHAFSIPKTRLYELMSTGRLPFVREGTRRLILREDILNYLASLKTGTASGADATNQDAA
jgi:excisionase family DNA binding protein